MTAPTRKSTAKALSVNASVKWIFRIPFNEQGCKIEQKIEREGRYDLSPLERRGVNRKTILRLLALSVIANRSPNLIGKPELRQWRSLAQRLRNISRDIRRAPWVVWPDPPNADVWADNVSFYSDYYKEYARKWGKHLRSNAVDTRQRWPVQLCQYVRSATGRNHYRELEAVS
jgi:hypothetical protein